MKTIWSETLVQDEEKPQKTEKQRKINNFQPLRIKTCLFPLYGTLSQLYRRGKSWEVGYAEEAITKQPVKHLKQFTSLPLPDLDTCIGKGNIVLWKHLSFFIDQPRLDV